MEVLRLAMDTLFDLCDKFVVRDDSVVTADDSRKEWFAVCLARDGWP